MPSFYRGDLIQRIEYYPFGEEKYVLNNNLEIDPSYTGQLYDKNARLYYYKSRYYNPKLARFIQPDTMIPDAKNLQSYNRYSYVENNPLKYTDPSGHSIFGSIWNFFFGGGGGGGPGAPIGVMLGGPGNLPTQGGPEMTNLANNQTLKWRGDGEGDLKEYANEGVSISLVGSIVEGVDDLIDENGFFEVEWDVFEKEQSYTKQINISDRWLFWRWEIREKKLFNKIPVFREATPVCYKISDKSTPIFKSVEARSFYQQWLPLPYNVDLAPGGEGNIPDSVEGLSNVTFDFMLDIKRATDHGAKDRYNIYLDQGGQCHCDELW